MQAHLAVSLVFLMIALGGCSRPGADAPRAESVEQEPDYAASNLTRVRPGYAIRIAGDNGDDLGAVRAYYVDDDGRIVWAAPADRTLEPADAPVENPAAIS